MFRYKPMTTAYSAIPDPNAAMYGKKNEAIAAAGQCKKSMVYRWVNGVMDRVYNLEGKLLWRKVSA